MLLRFIRKNTKLLFILILSFVLIPFLFFGIVSIGKQSMDETAPLQIGGKKISFAQLQQAKLDSQILILSDFIEANNIKTAEQFDLYKNWFNNIITQIDLNQVALKQLLLQNESKNYNLKPVSTAELRNWISEFPLFQRNGTFDIDLYNNIVNNYFHTAPGIFENSAKRVLTTKNFQTFITNNVFVSDKEILQAYKDKNEKAVVYYVYFNPLDYIAGIGNIDDSEIQDYYNIHRSEFEEPKKIKIAYLVFDPNEYKNQTTISQKEIEDYYKENKETFSPENEANTGSQQEKSQKESAVAKEQKKLNQDKQKTAKETDVEKQQTSDTIPQANQEILELSEEIKNKITNILIEKKANELCEKNGLETSIILTEEKKLGDMINIAKQRNLVLKETDFIPESQIAVQELGLTPQIMQTAWRMDINSISDLLRAGNKWIIISPVEKKDAYIPELNQVSKQIHDIIKNMKANELALKAAEKAKQQLPKNMPFPKAAKSIGLKPKKSKLITRSDELFSTTTKIVETSTGPALVSLKDIQRIDEKKWEKEKEDFEKSYLEQKKRQVFQNLINNISQNI